MILPDYEIHELCSKHAMVVPFDPELLNPASLDVLLGDRLMLEVMYRHELEIFDISHNTKSNPYWLAPGEFCLAETREIFNMRPDVAGQFVLKSSRAREGLSHALAGYLDPSWCGSRLTLELHNLRRHHSIALWPGLRIGQVVYHRIAGTPQRNYAEIGHYNNQPQVMPSWEAA